MNGSVAAIILIAAGLGAWLVVFLVIPWCLRSVFRYRLWALRDEVFDAAVQERLPVEESMRLVDEIEMAIRHSRELTAFNLFVIRLSLKGLPGPQKYVDPDVRAKHDAMLQLMARHVTMATPSGWVATVLFFVLIFPVLMIRMMMKKERADGAAKEERLDRIEEELAVTPALWREGRRLRSSRELALF